MHSWNMVKYLRDSPIETAVRNILAANPFRWRRLNSEFYRFLELLRTFESASFEEVRAYQFDRITSLVRRAYDSSPFYHEKYRSADFHPSHLRTWDDLSRIPYLTKAEAKEHASSLVIRSRSDRIVVGSTSGTTGKSLVLQQSRDTISRDWAAFCYQWARTGYAPGDGRVEFRGSLPADTDWRYYPEDRVLRINIIRMSEGNAERIARRIVKSGYRFFHGYPSAVYKFARIAERRGISLQPKGILLASEVMPDWMIDEIRRVFPGAGLAMNYGLAERIANAFRGEDGLFHFIPTYGVVEVDPVNHELIATGLLDDVMPFIRYRTNDVATNPVSATPVGTATLFPVVAGIEGRVEDFTYTTAGDLVPPAIVTFPFKRLKSITACKLIQNSLREFDLLLETHDPREAQGESDRLAADLRALYGADARITVQFLSNIPTDASGKFRWVECRYRP